MPKGEKLTVKQAGFVKDYIKTGNATHAAMKNYDVSSVQSAGQIGYENLKKLEEPIRDVMKRLGLTKDTLIKKVMDKMEAEDIIVVKDKLVKVPNHNAQLKAVDIAAKLGDFYPNTKLELMGKDGGPVEIIVTEDTALKEANAIEGELIDEEESIDTIAN